MGTIQHSALAASENHIPVHYNVADVTDMNALIGMRASDLCYVQNKRELYFYDSANLKWRWILSLNDSDQFDFQAIDSITKNKSASLQLGCSGNGILTSWDASGTVSKAQIWLRNGDTIVITARNLEFDISDLGSGGNILFANLPTSSNAAFVLVLEVDGTLAKKPISDFIP